MEIILYLILVIAISITTIKLMTNDTIKKDILIIVILIFIIALVHTTTKFFTSTTTIVEHNVLTYKDVTYSEPKTIIIKTVKGPFWSIYSKTKINISKEN